MLETSCLVSTRNHGEAAIPYSEAIITGLAEDKGLYVPQGLKTYGEADLRALDPSSYTHLFHDVSRDLIDEAITDAAFWDIVQNSYGPESFDAPDGNVVPLTEIDTDLYIQNLSLGPTAAFKDMALQPLARLMGYLLEKNDTYLYMLGATSGDTGSAAEAAFRHIKRAFLTMLSPQFGTMAEFQRAQMGVLTGGNIHNLSLPIDFDGCQDIVKDVTSDPEFKHLGAVNSINWGRVAAQIPYYFSAYLQIYNGQDIGKPIDVTVPTGNFGNILAGFMAKQMGLPIRRLIAATNENNVVDRLIQSGVYTYTEITTTSSPSMDIAKSSNFERLLYYMFDGDTTAVRAFMNQFDKTKTADLYDFGLNGPAAFKRLGFDSGTSNDANRLATIQQVYAANKHLIIDPHTADGVHVGRQKKSNDGVPMVCLATALPVKFDETTLRALPGITLPERSPRFKDLEARVAQKAGKGFVVVEPTEVAVKEYLRQHDFATAA